MPAQLQITCCVTGTPCVGPLVEQHCCNRHVCAGHEKAHDTYCAELKDLGREDYS